MPGDAASSNPCVAILGLTIEINELTDVERDDWIKWIDRIDQIISELDQSIGSIENVPTMENQAITKMTPARGPKQWKIEKSKK